MVYVQRIIEKVSFLGNIFLIVDPSNPFEPIIKYLNVFFFNW